MEKFNPRIKTDWDVTLTTITGEDVDITTMIEQISIYESIYNNCMFGSIIIKDQVGFIETFGLVGSGEEKITIFAETPNDTKGMETSTLEKEFVVNSLQDVKRSGDGSGTSTFVLGFVSPYLVKNNTKRISRSFNSMTSSEIVNYVGIDIMEFGIDTMMDWETLVTNTPSKHTKNIVVPNWKPFHLINFLSRNSISTDGYNDYIFFENSEGFHFTTLEDLKGKDIIRMVTVSELPVSIDSIGKGKVSIIGNQAEKYHELERFNLSNNISKGMYGGRMTSHNILTKTYDTYDIINEPLDSVLGDVGFGDVFKQEQIPQSHLGYMSANYLYDIHDKGERSHYPLYDMKMSSLRTNTVKFDIPGDTNIFAGNIIEVLIPSTIVGQTKEMDMYMSGNFLVTAIHHKLNVSGYTMTIECSKDGFDYDIDESTMEL